nr:hypothetical protein [Tanacetum cinerariifolium]
MIHLLGGHTSGSDEGSMSLKELTDLCTTLLQKIQTHLDEEAKTERERQEEAFKAALAEMYDEVQAQIDA